MGMKVKLPISSCTLSPKTLSFRATDNVFKTLNSVYFDSDDATSSDSDDDNNNILNNHNNNNVGRDDHYNNNDNDDDNIESIIRGAHSETRLFFEPSTAKTIAVATYEHDDDDDEKEGSVRSPFKESVVMAMESQDPYMDFRRSMEEMVETQGLTKDWGCLEELLAWYLRVNGRNNHAYIVAAFVDLLVKISSSSSSSSSLSSSDDSPKLNNEGYSSSSSSSVISRRCSSSVRRELLGKSSTSFSSAASSFSSDDHHGERGGRIHGFSYPSSFQLNLALEKD